MQSPSSCCRCRADLSGSGDCPKQAGALGRLKNHTKQLIDAQPKSAVAIVVPASEHRVFAGDIHAINQDFLRLNPVRAGFVNRTEDWPWVYPILEGEYNDREKLRPKEEDNREHPGQHHSDSLV
jgi:hypothetical protein